MQKKFLCFHTCKNENTEEYILQNSPFHSKRTVNQWLGQGYYLWTDSDFFAHEWGKAPPRNNKYAIVQFDLELDNSNDLLDLVGNVADQLAFKALVNEFTASLKKAVSDQSVDRAKRQRARIMLGSLSVSTVIHFFQKKRSFPYKAVKAQDIDSNQTQDLQFVVDEVKSKPSLLLYPTRQQVVVYEHGKSVLKNPAIYHIQ